MSKHDQDLIDKALSYTDGSDWNMIESLEKQAESTEAKKILHNHKTTLYHKEEGIDLI